MSLTNGKFTLFCMSLLMISSFSFANHEPGHESAPTATDSHENNEHKSGHKAEHGTDLFPTKQADAALGTAPAKTELKSPEFYSVIKSNEVTLNWSNTTGADSYHLQVATDANFKWLVVNEFFVKSNSYQLKSLETGKNYFWRVAGMKSDNEVSYVNGPFATSMFTTGTK